MSALASTGVKVTRDRLGRLDAPEWRAKRVRLLHGRPCTTCGAPWRKGRHALDHRLPVSFISVLNALLVAEGQTTLDSDEDANLQPLCRRCHRLKSAEDARMLAKLKKLIRVRSP